MTLLIYVKFFAVLTLVSVILVDLVASECTQIIIAEDGALNIDEKEFGICREDEFECRNRECIQSELLCNGIADCTDQSDETQTQCTKSEINCLDRAFRCDYGACVHENAICNGVKDCLDNSDELLPQCPRTPARISSPIFVKIYDDERDDSSFRYFFSNRDTQGNTYTGRFCGKETLRSLRAGNCMDLRLSTARRRIYRVKTPRANSMSSVSLGPLRPQKLLRPSLPPSTLVRFLPPLRSSESSTPVNSFCLVPPQPLNGQWKLHRRFCIGRQDCDIPQGVALQIGSQLVYNCADEFVLRGSADVYCETGGNWTIIPLCIVQTCDPLNSISRAATCSRFGDRVSCRSPVLPYTRAKVTCRRNYGLYNTFRTGFEQDVECRPNGRWEPEPITCSPVCGVENSASQKRPAINGIPTEVGAFPWHANVWRRNPTPRGSELEFRCSATIVEKKFLITTAHCVVDEKTGSTDHPERLRVTAGTNAEEETDTGVNSPWIVHKVKNVYRYCEYFGLVHGFASDIALVELKDPFDFSPVVLPACLDISSNSEQAFRPGVTGKTDGFGRRSVSTPSPILQTVGVTYIPNAECRTAFNPARGSSVISSDEFCGIYSNDTNVCDWDNGGGFVVKKGGLWHLMGVFIMDLGLGLEDVRRACGEDPYSLYTKVTPYMSWIQDVMFQLKRYKSYPRCSFDVTPLQATTTTTRPPFTRQTTKPSTTTIVTTSTASSSTTTPIPLEIRTAPSIPEFSCLTPLQPANGQWKLHQDLCNNTNCDVPENVLLSPGSQLVYSCVPGFRLRGISDVFCGAKGRWSTIPSCIEITCNSLESVSRMVTCYRGNNWAPCNASSLPETRVVISCRVGYREDTNSLKTGSKTVRCNQDGEWEPNPIACVPVCGLMNTRVTPTVINGTTADITKFPWHATLYKQMNVTEGSKDFICGATIIQNNLLLTAAHCVYDDVYKAVEIPEKFSVAAGNIFRDYDSPLHDPRIVQKSMVKNIYVPCEYYSLEGNYASDIALIELREPFQLSEILLPACLDVLGNSEQILEPGAVGNFAGFGRTATGKSSALLLTTDIPYVSYSQCKMSQKGDGNVALIVRDKFCGGNSEGMTVCHGDSGGGLTFENSGISYVMGILSVNLGADTSTGERSCDENTYSLYTKVSNHMPWIRDVMSHLERDKTYPSCGSR